MSRTSVKSVVKVLLRKRAALAAAVAQAEAVVQARRQEVAHIDAAIQLLATDDPPNQKRPGRPGGSLSRTLIGILRSTGQALPIQMIVDKYIAASGQPAGERAALTPAVRRSLINLRNRGAVSTAPGPKGGYLWRISSELSEIAGRSP